MTRFSGVPQWNSVNGVVRMFSIHLPLKGLKTSVCYLAGTFPPGGYSTFGQQFGLSLCPRSVLLSGGGDTGVRWSNTWHMVVGMGRWWVGSLYKTAATWRLCLQLGTANWEEAGEPVHSNSGSRRLGRMSRLSPHPSHRDPPWHFGPVLYGLWLGSWCSI